MTTTAVLEEVVEDVVDYEPWMSDYGKQPYGVEFDDKDTRCTKHPELWLSADKIEEIKKAEADEKQKADAAAAAVVAAAEAKKKKIAAKKKGKDKDEGPSTKKGIPAKKNVEEVDEVTQIASQMTHGLDSEDILGAHLDDSFFDFGNDLSADDFMADMEFE